MGGSTKAILLSILMIFTSIISVYALKLSELQSSGKFEISKCDGSGFHTVTTDYGIETISCNDLKTLEGEFAAASGNDMNLQSVTWIQMPSGNWALQVICVGTGTGCIAAKAQAFSETGNPIFNH
jgi:hypothetical protein